MLGLVITGIVIGTAAVLWAAWGHGQRRARLPTYLGLFDMSNLPESIRVVRLDRRSTVVSEWIERTGAALVEQGYEDAGYFTLHGSSNVTIRLLAHPGHSVYAALYDHETTGRWMDVVTTYATGDQMTFTTRVGLDRDPVHGHRVVQVRGAGPYAPHARMCTERPMGVLRPVNMATVANQYENAWGLWLEWKRGTSRAAAQAA